MLCLAMVQELASGETRQAMAKDFEIADLIPPMPGSPSPR